jgi:phosphohistidine phosphatase SixA
MKEIILIRHAKVDVSSDTTMYAHELKAWVKNYDNAEIDLESLPDENLKKLVAKAGIIVCSTAYRTAQTAKVLGVVAKEKNPMFNEVPIPDMDIPFFKFKAKTWLILMRVVMFLRLGGQKISLKRSKLQAEKAAQRLMALSEEYGSVVLIGHGGTNWMIRKALLKEGWVLKEASNKNWGVTRLTL